MGLSDHINDPENEFFFSSVRWRYRRLDGWTPGYRQHLHGDDVSTH